MIALLSTYLIVAYVLIPGVCFRTVVGFVVKLRLFQLTKTQEATFGVLVAVLPFLAAYVFVWHVPIAQVALFSYPVGSIDQYENDRRLLLTLTVSLDASRLLQSDRNHESEYWQALARIWHRQTCFLCWYYLFSGAEGALFAYFARKYGDWGEKYAIYAWLARKILLPYISEWQLLLTDFNFPNIPKREVAADVLCDNQLYRGKIEDYFLDTNGHLSGLYMKEVDRFRRKDFEAAREKAEGGQVDNESFWRKIPGSNFYIPADKITNLNVRFPYVNDSELQDYILELLKPLLKGEGDLKTDVSVSVEKTKRNGESGDSESISHPPEKNPAE